MRLRTVYTRICIIVIIGITSLSCNKGDFINNGNSDFQIIITNEASADQQKAAMLLQEYVSKITGFNMDISTEKKSDFSKYIILETKNEMHPDGFSLAKTEEGFSILGGSHKGCIYGVVQLLENEWGCRMYSPDFEVVPQSTNLSLPDIPILDKPANNYRIINGRFCLDSIYQDWHKLDVVQDQFANKYYVHTFNRLIPWEQNFDSHPEYYSEVSGRRIKDQICLTNPKVLELAIEKLRQEMAEQPDKKLWSVSQNDNFSFCQCENCQELIDEEGSAAGPIIHFVNKIAQEFPDKIISTLAYQYSRQAPKHIKPVDNVQVMLCTIELNRSLPISEDPASKSFLKDIEDWGKIAHHIYLWDYTVNFSHHISPFPNIHVLQSNIQLFIDNNVHEHFQQSNTDIGHEFSELKSYLISRLLWNPAIDVDSVIHDFTEGYYGEAAQMVRDYLNSIQNDIQESQEWLDIYGHPTAHENSFLSEDKVNRYLDMFSRARATVKNDSARLIHLREAELPIQYAAMEIGKNHMFDSRGWYEVKNGEYIARQNMIQILEDFIETCRLSGVNSINEAGLKPEEYYWATKRFVDVQVDGNIAFMKSVEADPLPSTRYSKGDLAYLSNGVQGASDYKVHWLGWEAKDFNLVVDLKSVSKVETITISSLYDPKSWIFHPKSLNCMISEDGQNYTSIGARTVDGDQKGESLTREYSFRLSGKAVRFIRMEIEGIHQNPRWHPSAGGESWTFIDEIVVR